MHHFSKISLTLKISHGLQNRNNIEILMKLENFCVFSFLALFCERKDLYKEVVFYIGLAYVAQGRTERFLPDKPLCLRLVFLINPRIYLILKEKFYKYCMTKTLNS